MLSKRVQLFISTVTGRFWSWRSREDGQGHLVHWAECLTLAKLTKPHFALLQKEWLKSRISDLIPYVESTIGDLSFRMIQILEANCEQLEQRCVFRKIPPHSVKLKERNQSNNVAEAHMVLNFFGQKTILEVMEPTKEEWLKPF